MTLDERAMQDRASTINKGKVDFRKILIENNMNREVVLRKCTLQWVWKCYRFFNGCTSIICTLLNFTFRVYGTTVNSLNWLWKLDLNPKKDSWTTNDGWHLLMCLIARTSFLYIVWKNNYSPINTIDALQLHDPIADISQLELIYTKISSHLWLVG